MTAGKAPTKKKAWIKPELAKSDFKDNPTPKTEANDAKPGTSKAGRLYDGK